MRKDIIDPGSGEGFKNEKFLSIAILILIIIAVGGFAIVRSDAEFDLPAFGGEEPAEEEVLEESAEEAEGEQVSDETVEDEEEYDDEDEEEDTEVERIDEGETGIAQIEDEEPAEEEEDEIAFEEEEEAVDGPSYGVTAQRGDGLTHVARRALDAHLQTRGGERNLTAEHKVFVEDYVQKNLNHSTGWLQLGETVEVPVELVEEAIEEAEQLTEDQLQNLSQYTV